MLNVVRYAGCRYAECRYAECRGAHNKAPSQAYNKINFADIKKVLEYHLIHNKLMFKIIKKVLKRF
jgi:hypothetical protein